MWAIWLFPFWVGIQYRFYIPQKHIQGLFFNLLLAYFLAPRKKKNSPIFTPIIYEISFRENISKQTKTSVMNQYIGCYAKISALFCTMSKFQNRF